MRAGNRRELSRWFSAADAGKLTEKEWSALWRSALESKAVVIGVGGPPGAGKSTLLREFAERFISKKNILALCIDPTSPLSGGAFLGDRVRLQSKAVSEEKLYIRSLASHEGVGAVSPTLDDMILVGKSAGFDVIFVEGVGSGQAEYALRDFVDLFCVLLVPESGDSVQLLKAGTLELADLIILNKNDRPGAESLWQNLEESFDPKMIFRVTAQTGDGCDELVKTLEEKTKNPKLKSQRHERLVRACCRRVSLQISQKMQKTLFEQFRKVKPAELPKAMASALASVTSKAKR